MTATNSPVDQSYTVNTNAEQKGAKHRRPPIAADVKLLKAATRQLSGGICGGMDSGVRCAGYWPNNESRGRNPPVFQTNADRGCHSRLSGIAAHRTLEPMPEENSNLFCRAA